MPVRVGRGDFIYEERRGWGEFPEGYTFGDVADVAIDSRGDLYVADVARAQTHGLVPDDWSSLRKYVRV